MHGEGRRVIWSGGKEGVVSSLVGGAGRSVWRILPYLGHFNFLFFLTPMDVSNEVIYVIVKCNLLIV